MDTRRFVRRSTCYNSINNLVMVKILYDWLVQVFELRLGINKIWMVLFTSLSLAGFTEYEVLNYSFSLARSLSFSTGTLRCLCFFFSRILIAYILIHYIHFGVFFCLLFILNIRVFSFFPKINKIHWRVFPTLLFFINFEDVIAESTCMNYVKNGTSIESIEITWLREYIYNWYCW